MGLDLLSMLLNRGKNTSSLIGQTTSQPKIFSFGDALNINLSKGDTVIQIAARKMQEAFSKSVTLANGQVLSNGRVEGGGVGVNMRGSESSSLSFSSFSVNGSFSFGTASQYKHSSEEVEMGVQMAGGREALEPWLVDGQTKIEVNGRRSVAQVNPGSGSGGGDAKAAAAESIARFGLSASSLDGDLDQLRNDLRSAAQTAQQNESPDLNLAIEYALEDAFTKIRRLENPTAAADHEKQRATNMEQATSIQRQLNLGESSDWALKSTAEDLALFGKDLSALNDRYGLAAEIKSKAAAMQEELKQSYVGTEIDYFNEARKISGALSRVLSGLERSDPVAVASARLEVSATARVTVGGVDMNAASVVSMVSVIADPLVFDLNGDGFDFSAAEEGVEFDMNGNGVKAKTGFIRGDDALLFLDEDGDGVVSDGKELFGNANGFEKLKQYDDNGDGVIDENDAIYHRLRLWQELEEDGVCEIHETMSLAEAGIKSINLNYDNVREDDGKGNLIGQSGSFTREDGTTDSAVDAWFRELP